VEKALTSSVLHFCSSLNYLYIFYCPDALLSIQKMLECPNKWTGFHEMSPVVTVHLIKYILEVVICIILFLSIQQNIRSSLWVPWISRNASFRNCLPYEMASSLYILIQCLCRVGDNSKPASWTPASPTIDLNLLW